MEGVGAKQPTHSRVVRCQRLMDKSHLKVKAGAHKAPVPPTVLQLDRTCKHHPWLSLWISTIVLCIKGKRQQVTNKSPLLIFSQGKEFYKNTRTQITYSSETFPVFWWVYLKQLHINYSITLKLKYCYLNSTQG